MAARFGLALLLVAAIGGATSAQTVKLFDNFDSYTTQAEFETAWPVTGAAGTLLQTEADAGFPPVTGPNMVGMPTTAVRNGKGITGLGLPSTSNVVSFSFDFYDSNAGVAPYRQFNNLQTGAAPTLTNQLVSLGLNNNQSIPNSGGNYYMARILGYTPSTTVADPDGGPMESVAASSSFFKLNDFGVGLRSTGWHNLRVDITSDNAANGADYSFFVDGVLAERVSNVGTAVHELDTLRLGSGITSVNVAYTDNFSIVLNPNGVVAPTNNADFNNDNIVDGADFLIWQRGFGTAAAAGDKSTGDANGDLAVNGLDLDAWKAKFGGAPAVAAVAAVPEPAAMVLAGLALVGALAGNRRR